MPIRARNMREHIKTLGFERGITATLEDMLGEQAMMRQHMREITELAAQCVDQLERFVHISGGMREAIDQIRRDRKGDEHGTGSEVPSSN